MEKKEKIGLVVEGGGMKCAYNAGTFFLIIRSHLTTVSEFPGAREMWRPLWQGSGGGIYDFLQSISILPNISG